MRPVEIIDCGRGPQLSTCRITVQDLVPYLRERYSYEQILEIMPVLTREEFEAVERYVQSNYDAVMDQDRHIREQAIARQKPSDAEESERQERLHRLESARQRIRRQQERNGDSASG
jgi:uncharacterized protein (DUF433 family)